MTIHFTAIFEKGVLRPTIPLSLDEGQSVQVALETQSPTASDDASKIRNAKTFDDWIAAAEAASQLEPDDGYDLLDALNENRKQAGAPILYPPELKGTAW